MAFRQSLWFKHFFAMEREKKSLFQQNGDFPTEEYGFFPWRIHVFTLPLHCKQEVKRLKH
jgi:hypothetical protein